MSKIDKPKHYQAGDLSANDVIRAFNLNFALGNVIKYILRAGKKPNEPAIDDLRKAIWYLQDEYNSRVPKSDLDGLASREAFVDALRGKK